MHQYFQYQVILKPSPVNIQDLYLESLVAIGFDLSRHDIRFVHDDWEQPTLGAWGLGWEVWVDGMESSQFTYFQAMAELPLKPVTGELTYGLERLAMHLQKVDSFTQIKWNNELTYGDLYTQNEIEWSNYNFDVLDPDMMLKDFEDYAKEAKRLVSLNLPIPAYDFVLKCSHTFNLLDARGVISVSERARYIASIRDLAKLVAVSFLQGREKQKYPLLSKWQEYTPKTEPAQQEPMPAPSTKEKTDFLLEVGSEEIPASFVSIGLASFERQIKQLLDKEELSYSSIQTYGTPRRLAVLVKDLATKSQAKQSEKKGPAVTLAFDEKGMPTSIGQGFLKTLQLETISLDAITKGSYPQIEIRKVKDTDYLFAKTETQSVEVGELLQKNLSQIILNIDFPKKMRWANFDISFARPIRWIIALLDDKILPVTVGPITSGRKSSGHRQLSPETFEIARASDYVEALRARNVIVDPKERLNEIVKQLQAIENETKLSPLVKERVSHEVMHLVEKPFLTVGEFDTHFFKAPKEVLVSEMVEHQKYFPLADAAGKLQNKFVITCNVPPTDSIRYGNRKVLSARLTDGVFLFEQDSKKPLISFNEKLKTVIFQKKLGTVWNKVERIEKLTALIHPYMPQTPLALALDAAALCKADLATEMVGEFPELQGVMGSIYAKDQGKPEEVFLAIDEHWMPRGEKAPLPKTATGVLLSLADKIDTLVGFFAIDLKPTSSSDPYALRRQAIGVVRILLEHKLSLPLSKLLQSALKIMPSDLQNASVVDEVLQFVQARAKGLLQDMGFAKDEIEACMAVRSDDFYDVLCRLQALKAFKAQAHFTKLLEVHKRCSGQIAGKNGFTVSQSLPQEPAEKSLYEIVQAKKAPYTAALGDKRYAAAFDLLADLQPALAELFDKVKILDDREEIRSNRLALLQEVAALFSQIADFQKIQ
jgi:glycyl-tRNA synthetase